MAKKFFTTDSLATLISEIKAYVASAVSGKSDSGHTHSISNVANLQSALDGKADSSHTHNYAGSSSVGGAATSANKLNANAGNATQPVYFENGVPVKTTYTLEKSVPSDAKFTDTTYSKATTTSDGLMSLEDKIKLNYTNIAYGTCSTDAATAEKAIVLDGNSQWSLTKGSIIAVYFNNSNTASSVKLNVNGTGAYPIWYNNAEYTSTGNAYTGYAKRVTTYMFNGTHYVWIASSYDANTSYTNAALGQGYVTCSTAAATTAKVGSLSSYKLTTGGIVSVKFTYAVPANATLNINSVGAKNIYYRGSAITGDIIKAGDVATFIYSSQYHLISIDRWQEDVKNIQTSLDEKVPTSRTVNGKALSSNITLSASDVGAAPSSHSHDDLYYTEVEIDTKLESKSDTSHKHDNLYDAKGSASAVQANLDEVSNTLSSHTGNSNIHVTTTNKTNWNTAYTHSQATHARTDATKVEDSSTNGNILINGTETTVYSHPNSGVTAGTYKSVTVNAQGHITGGSNPTTLSGFGITDAETKANASEKLAEAKLYTDTAISNLINGAPTTLDTLGEIATAMKSNADVVDALEEAIGTKANATHGHEISEVNGLQSALDGKASSSHGTHVTFDSTNTPKMDGTAAFGTSTKVARADHVHPTDTSRASQVALDEHTGNTTAHITSTERTNWNAAKTHADSAHAPSNAEKNQNAFSNVKVGTTTIAADTTTDTLELVGSNVTITPDATNDKVTISVADGSTSTKGIVQLTNSTSSTSTTTAATPSSVKSAYDLANQAKTAAATAQSTADGKANATHTHKVSEISDLTATATELNYMDGVTSNVQAQLDAKVPSGRTINGKALSSNITLSAGDVSAYSKTEINNMEFITTSDIDTICGMTIQEATASEVTF